MTHLHTWQPSDHSGWLRCSECRTLHNPQALPKEHYLDQYWGPKHGHSSIVEQRYNLESVVNENGESKVQSVLKYAVGNSLLEIGCSPGSILKAAKEKGMECTGIEPDRDYAVEVCDYSGCDVRIGFFDDLQFEPSTRFSTIISTDVLEHIHDGPAFVQKCLWLIADGGRLILMLPILDEAGEPQRVQDLHPEHAYLYSREYINEWLDPIAIDQFLPGHDIVVVTK